MRHNKPYPPIYFLYPKLAVVFQDFPEAREALPPYFTLVDFISKRPSLFWAFTAVFWTSLVLSVKAGPKSPLPFVRKPFTEFGKLALFAHLYVSLKAGLSEKEALERYSGLLADYVKKVLSLVLGGVHPRDAFLKVLGPILDPIEKAFLANAFLGRAEEGFKELFEDKLYSFSVFIEKFQTYVSVFMLVVVGLLILGLYAGLFVPMISAMIEIAQ